MFEQEIHGSGLLLSQPISVPTQRMVEVQIKLIKFSQQENTLAALVLERNANDQFVALDSVLDSKDLIVLSTTGVIRLQLTIDGPAAAVLIRVPQGEAPQSSTPLERADQGPLFAFNEEAGTPA